jgi:hypothetical protein
VTCAAPSALGTSGNGYVSCGANANDSCAAIYPYHCPQTHKCWATQEEAAANCGTNTCFACVMTTCRCSCTCMDSSFYPHYTTCLADPGLDGCTGCCMVSCPVTYSSSGFPSSCTALP